MKPRLLFFDSLRVISILLVVLCHTSTVFNLRWFPNEPFFNFIYLNPGEVGVAMFIFVSGAVLEYTHPKLSTLDEILKFYLKRVVRIYPAFWISLVIGLVCAPYLLTMSKMNLFIEFTGFVSWTGNWGGYINGVGWFIGLIMVLYILYPIFSSSIKEHPFIILFLITIVEVGSRCFLNIHPVPELGIYQPDRWLPFCNFLEFGLGIWIVQNNLYPKWTTENEWVLYAAEISFYVYLIHYLESMKVLWYNSPLIYIIAVLMMAWMMMALDTKIQEKIKPYF